MSSSKDYFKLYNNDIFFIFKQQRNGSQKRLFQCLHNDCKSLLLSKWNAL